MKNTNDLRYQITRQRHREEERRLRPGVTRSPTRELAAVLVARRLADRRARRELREAFTFFAIEILILLFIGAAVWFLILADNSDLLRN